LSIKVESILFVGVGGDGIITVSNIVAEAFMLADYDVKKSEIHGMSQRGGSVSASVRFGDRVYSPTDKKAGVGFVIATEKVEFLRWVGYYRKNAVCVVNDRLVPIINKELDEGFIDKAIEDLKIEKLIKRRFLDDALKIGNPRVANTIMLGVISRFLPVDVSTIKEAIERVVPGKVLEINLRAFEHGLNIQL